jgi:hypothetical protein
MENKSKNKKPKWVGDPLNDSDVGYDSEWEPNIPMGSPGPREPIKTDKEEEL